MEMLAWEDTPLTLITVWNEKGQFSAKEEM